MVEVVILICVDVRSRWLSSSAKLRQAGRALEAAQLIMEYTSV